MHHRAGIDIALQGQHRICRNYLIYYHIGHGQRSVKHLICVQLQVADSIISALKGCPACLQRNRFRCGSAHADRAVIRYRNTLGITFPTIKYPSLTVGERGDLIAIAPGMGIAIIFCSVRCISTERFHAPNRIRSAVQIHIKYDLVFLGDQGCLQELCFAAFFPMQGQTVLHRKGRRFRVKCSLRKVCALHITVDRAQLQLIFIQRTVVVVLPNILEAGTDGGFIQNDLQTLCLVCQMLGNDLIAVAFAQITVEDLHLCTRGTELLLDPTGIHLTPLVVSLGEHQQLQIHRCQTVHNQRVIFLFVKDVVAIVIVFHYIVEGQHIHPVIRAIIGNLEAVCTGSVGSFSTGILDRNDLTVHIIDDAVNIFLQHHQNLLKTVDLMDRDLLPVVIVSTKYSHRTCNGSRHAVFRHIDYVPGQICACEIFRRCSILIEPPGEGVIRFLRNRNILMKIRIPILTGKNHFLLPIQHTLTCLEFHSKGGDLHSHHGNAVLLVLRIVVIHTVQVALFGICRLAAAASVIVLGNRHSSCV